jgi:transposase
MQEQFTKIDLTGEPVFVGIDVHLKSWKVTVMTRRIVHKTFSAPPQAEKLHRYLLRSFPGADYFSAYEAGFSGFWLHRELTKLGVKSIVVNAADIPTTDKERKQKEDKRDSRKIAQSLRSGDLQGVYVPSEISVQDRALVRTRATMVKDITRTKNRIKSSLYFSGLHTQVDCDKNWSKRFIDDLRKVKFEHPSGQASLRLLLDQLEQQRSMLLQINRQIKELSNTSAYKADIDLLLTVPGFGLTSSMVLLTEISDINRFKEFIHLCSYIGLVPSTASSGENTVINGITPRKNPRLRGILIESAWIAIRNDPALMLAYETLTKRMHGNRAITRIAKKLLNRIWHVLRTKQPYQKGIK